MQYTKVAERLMFDFKGKVAMCTCGCKSEYYGICVDHFSGLCRLRPFARKVAGPVADWFADVIRGFRNLEAAWPECVLNAEGATMLSPNAKLYKHDVKAVQSVSVRSCPKGDNMSMRRIMAARL